MVMILARAVSDIARRFVNRLGRVHARTFLVACRAAAPERGEVPARTRGAVLTRRGGPYQIPAAEIARTSLAPSGVNMGVKAHSTHTWFL